MLIRFPGNASNVVLENGERLDLRSNAADTTMVDKGGVLAVNNGGTATNVTINEAVLIADNWFQRSAVQTRMGDSVLMLHLAKPVGSGWKTAVAGDCVR